MNANEVQLQRVNMIRYLNNYHKACPNTKVVLAGYSGGAIITMNAVCGASEWPWHNSTPLAAKWTNTGVCPASSSINDSQHRPPCEGLSRSAMLTSHSNCCDRIRRRDLRCRRALESWYLPSGVTKQQQLLPTHQPGRMCCFRRPSPRLLRCW